MRSVRKIKNVREYLNCVKEIRDKWRKIKDLDDEYRSDMWFRGQSNFKYKLRPSIYRDSINHKYERVMTREFRHKAISFPGHHPQTDVEWLSLGRHHGLPTRLLDWSKGSLIGLFFAALEDKRQHKKDGQVWILNPRSLNLITQKVRWKEDFDGTNYHLQGTVPTHESNFIKNYVISNFEFNLKNPQTLQAKYPFAIQSSSTSNRIVAQRGVFTIHGTEKLGIDELKENVAEYKGLKLASIKIVHAFKLNILLELRDLGISYSTLFPDLDGLCEDIKINFMREEE